MRSLTALRLISFVRPVRPQVSFALRASYSAAAMASPQPPQSPKSLAQDEPQTQRVAKRQNGGSPASQHKKPFKKKKSKREKNIKEGSSEEILRLDILSLIESQRAKRGDVAEGE